MVIFQKPHSVSIQKETRYPVLAVLCAHVGAPGSTNHRVWATALTASDSVQQATAGPPTMGATFLGRGFGGTAVGVLLPARQTCISEV